MEESSISHLGKLLIGFGLFCCLLGAFFLFGHKIPFLSRLGSLPGDIKVEGKDFSVYFPWVSCILVSIVLTLISLFFAGFRK